jgi:6-phosphogluconate dehydrogenase
MQLGIIGLGRMGGNIARRLMANGHSCVVYDTRKSAIEELAKDGASGANDLSNFTAQLQNPRAIWIMLPAGEITENTITEISPLLQPGDILIDGGNSWYRDDIRRARMLQAKGIHFIDVGTSGGVWGLQRGYCMMIGGDHGPVQHLDPIFSALAPGMAGIPPAEGRAPGGTAERGYLHCGPAGAGHFVKMVHNGIEYGLMEAYAEGFDILRHATTAAQEEEQYRLDLPEVAELWRRGSVIGSWLLDLTASALAEDPELSRYTGYVDDSGEGRWTIMAAIETGVPADVLSAALYSRFRSRGESMFANKLLSAMRNKFGGHVEPKHDG